MTGSNGDIDVAIIVTNGENAATCMVIVPEGMESTRFTAIGRDGDGPFLADSEGDSVRIGAELPVDFDDIRSYSTLRLTVIGHDGNFIDEYDISAAQPEPAFGA